MCQIHNFHIVCDDDENGNDKSSESHVIFHLNQIEHHLFLSLITQFDYKFQGGSLNSLR